MGVDGTRVRHTPDWLWALLGVDAAVEGSVFDANGCRVAVRNGIPRASGAVSDTQQATRASFEHIWGADETFHGDAGLSVLRQWYLERYGDVANAPWWSEYGDLPLVVDAGCGAGISALELFGDRLRRVRYLGIDLTGAVDRAAARFDARGIPAGFLQANLMELPLPESSADVIYSQGVLHHTDSTERALKYLATRLKTGGRILFYVYRKKGPIREFTDDYVRSRLKGLTPERASAALTGLTAFGRMLGELNFEIDVPEAIDVLEIPAGRINLQRFFYWHVAKAFYHPDMTFDEMHHINVDWYAPVNAHRQTPEQVRTWCREAGLEIEHENLQEAGITVIARRA
jgi:SAM-dependent methyltransferase